MADTNYLYDTNPFHNLLLKDRKSLEISGIKQIERFDEEEFVLESILGWMEITGKELTLDKLDKERGEVIIKGHIESIVYTSNKKSEKGSLLGKIFK